MTAYPVILRRERRANGDLFAVFPTLPWDHAGQTPTVLCMESGPGGLSRAYYDKSRPATDEEAATLCGVLRAHGYTFDPEDKEPRGDFGDEPTLLVARRRWTYAHDKLRRAEALCITGAASK